MLSEILEIICGQGKNEKACLQVTLCPEHRPGCHRLRLVNCLGDLHLQDPFTKQKWGGEPEELQHIASYLKSMCE